MALSKAKFKATATKIFTKAKNGNLTESATFRLAGSIDPITEIETGSFSETVQVIIETYNKKEVDGQQVQANDLKMLILADDLKSIDPRTDGMTLIINGSTLTIMAADIDTAKAVWTVQIRGTIPQEFNGNAEIVEFLAGFNGAYTDGAKVVDVAVNESMP